MSECSLQSWQNSAFTTYFISLPTGARSHNQLIPDIPQHAVSDPGGGTSHINSHNVSAQAYKASPMGTCFPLMKMLHTFFLVPANWYEYRIQFAYPMRRFEMSIISGPPSCVFHSDAPSSYHRISVGSAKLQFMCHGGILTFYFHIL